jgi:TonB family protein
VKRRSAFSIQQSAKHLVTVAMCAFFCWASVTCLAASFDGKALEPDLQARYKDKVVMLRNFYCGENLRFDAQGNLMSGGPAGSWTVCRDIRIKDVKIKNGKVTLKGQRIYLSYDYKEHHFRDAAEVWKQRKHEYKGDKVSIDMELQPNADETTVQDGINKLFYSSEEDFSKTMPRLWRGCLVQDLNQQAKPVSKIEPAHDSSGASMQGDHGNQPAQNSQPGAGDSNAILHVGKGVTAPQPLFAPDPDYSDVARSAKFQGNVVMNAIVGPDGRIHSLALVRCAGLGLDERAVEKILSWKFKPATKDGKPVAVEVSVEVSFHLY